jgi:O-antigen/teichoic acid export membrane protein
MRLSHISWNLTGLVLPLVAAALAVPSLLERLGPQRFGVLALAWGLIGYASAIDLGIGRAVTQSISSLINTKNIKRESDILEAALQITLISGFISFLIIMLLALIGAERWMGAAEIPSAEKTMSIALLAFALPLQAISATYRGVNEAHLNFKKVSLLRIALGVANFGAPYVISYFTVQLQWLVASLVFSRLISFFFYRDFALKLIEGKRKARTHSQKKLVRLLRSKLIKFGGWITISSIINPVVNAADRFLLASVVSASAVTIYVIPFELTTQSLILVGAVSTVFFPNSSRSGRNELSKTKHDFFKVVGVLSGIMACVTIGYFLIGSRILSLWLGTSLNEESVHVLKIISIGLAPYAIASLSTSFIHSKGNSKLTALVNIVMFFPSLLLLYFSIKLFGPIGAAFTWVTRIVIEAISFYWISLWQIGLLSKAGRKSI